jgi:hypothetical protein
MHMHSMRTLEDHDAASQASFLHEPEHLHPFDPNVNLHPSDVSDEVLDLSALIRTSVFDCMGEVFESAMVPYIAALTDHFDLLTERMVSSLRTQATVMEAAVDTLHEEVHALTALTKPIQVRATFRA